MIEIKSPATSANFSIGFDSIGICFDLFNTFRFEKNDSDLLIGFDEEFNNQDNLALKTYKNFFHKFNLAYIPVKISLIKEEIPKSRGLGSSASLIVASSYAAYIFSNKVVKKDDFERFIIEEEGHPDNVIPCLYGGMKVTIYDNAYHIFDLEVSPKLKFYALVPNFKLSTSESRNVLPKNYKREDVVYNLSRALVLSKALKDGDLNSLKMILKDKIHEPYRFPLILNAATLKEELDLIGGITILSGSGSTLLYITDKDLFIKEKLGFKMIKLNLNQKGVIINEL